MYVIELIVKLIKKVRGKRTVLPPMPVGFEDNIGEEQEEDCREHIYLPIDSTKRYLACKNCGRVIKNMEK